MCKVSGKELHKGTLLVDSAGICDTYFQKWDRKCWAVQHGHLHSAPQYCKWVHVSTILMAEGCRWRKCVPYMGALAAAGCTLRHATVGSGHGCLGAVIARQAAGCNVRCALTGGFLVWLMNRSIESSLKQTTGTHYKVLKVLCTILVMVNCNMEGFE